MMLGEILIAEGALDAEGLQEALDWQVLYGGRLGTNLLELRLVEEPALAQALGKQLGCEVAWGELHLEPELVALVPRHVADQQEIVPWKMERRRLRVLCTKPSVEVFDALAFKLGRPCQPVVAPEYRIIQLLRRDFGAKRQMRALDFGVVPEEQIAERRRKKKREKEGEAAEAAPELIDEAAFNDIYSQVLAGRDAQARAAPAGKSAEHAAPGSSEVPAFAPTPAFDPARAQAAAGSAPQAAVATPHAAATEHAAVAASHATIAAALHAHVSSSGVPAAVVHAAPGAQVTPRSHATDPGQSGPSHPVSARAAPSHPAPAHSPIAQPAAPPTPTRPVSISRAPAGRPTHALADALAHASEPPAPAAPAAPAAPSMHAHRGHPHPHPPEEAPAPAQDSPPADAQPPATDPYIARIAKPAIASATTAATATAPEAAEIEPVLLQEIELVAEDLTSESAAIPMVLLESETTSESEPVPLPLIEHVDTSESPPLKLEQVEREKTVESEPLPVFELAHPELEAHERPAAAATPPAPSVVKPSSSPGKAREPQAPPASSHFAAWDMPRAEVPLIDTSPLAFADALTLLAGVVDRGAIAHAVLRAARSVAARALLLTVQGGVVLGWDGLGEGFEGGAARAIAVPLSGESVFQFVVQMQSHYMGPLRKTPANVRFLAQTGKKVPLSVVVLPILFRGRVSHLLYLDNGHKQQAPTEVGEMLILAQRVAQKVDALVAKKRRDPA